MTQGPKSLKLLGILYNESKHNIVALVVGKAKKEAISTGLYKPCYEIFSNPYLTSLDPGNKNKLQLSVFFWHTNLKANNLRLVFAFLFQGIIGPGEGQCCLYSLEATAKLEKANISVQVPGMELPQITGKIIQRTLLFLHLGARTCKEACCYL